MKIEAEAEETTIVEVKINKEDSSWIGLYWLFGFSCPEGQVCDEDYASDDLFLNDVDNNVSKTAGEEHVI